MSFYATVDPNYIAKASRYFSHSVRDILVELLQNSRRAGATAVTIVLDEEKESIAVLDNGQGIEDPKTILTLGETTWGDKIQKVEDPAGCGVFSLAGCSEVQIISRDWKLDLSPEKFCGQVPVQPIYEQPFYDGTAIWFRYSKSQLDSRFPVNLIKAVCEFVPLNITLKHKEETLSIGGNAFLKNAIYSKSWQGLNLGVVKNSGSASNCNFFGLQLNLPFDCPRMKDKALTVYIDFVDCEELKLVLPDRKEFVNNAFLAELKVECERVIFEYLQTLPTHQLTTKSWRRAAQLGVKLPEPNVILDPVEIQDDNSNVEDILGINSKLSTVVLPVSSTQYVLNAGVSKHYNDSFTVSDRIPVYQLLRTWLAHCDDVNLVLPNAQYRGLSSYDTLPRIVRIDPISFIEGTWEDVDYENRKVEKLALELTIEQEQPDGTVESWEVRLPLDFWAGDSQNSINHLIVSNEFGYEDLDELVENIVLVHWVKNYDSEDYGDDESNFRVDCISTVYDFLVDEKEAIKKILQEKIAQHILYSVPSGYSVTIQLTQGPNRKIDIQITS